MSRYLVVSAVALALGVAALVPLGPGGSAQTTADGFVAVGTDPAGDATNDIVPGVDADAAVTSDRTDILALDLGVDDGSAVLRMTIGTPPSGTSGYLYAVHFEVAGEPYFTCFTTQWVGGTTSQENIKGCSRFTEGTPVGPATTADGVLVEGEGPGLVSWPVPLADMGAALGDTLDNVVATTWFRGVSDCCVGSTTDSQYMWNQADVAPDDGVWTATLGTTAPMPAPDLVLQAEAPPAFVTEGDTLRINGTVSAAGAIANGTTYPLVSTLVGVTWPNLTEPDDVALDANVTTVNLTLVIDVPTGAAGTQANLTWRVCRDASATTGTNVTDNTTGNGTAPTCGEAVFPVTVYAAGDDGPPAPAPVATNATAEPSDGSNGTADVADDESLPGPSAIVASTVILGAAAALRRRR